MIAFLSRSLLVLATTSLVLTSCGTTARTVKAPPVPEVKAMTPRATGEVPFERAWELQLPGKVERSWMCAGLPGVAFFQIAGTHEIHCVDAVTGITRWVSERFTHPILGEAYVQRQQVLGGGKASDVVYDDRLYIVVDDTLHCIDVATGQRAWHFVLPFAPSTGPLAAGATEGGLRVFIGDWNNKIQVVGLNLPKEDERTAGGQGHRRKETMFPYVVWQMNMSGAVLAQGHEADNLVFFGDASGALRCFKLDREMHWEVLTGGAVDGGATTRGRILYAGNASNALHVLNLFTGERLGQLNLQGPVRKRPFWFAGEPERLYVWVDSPDHAIGGLLALTVQTENIRISTDEKKQPIEIARLAQAWRVPGATRLLGSTPLHLLVSDNEQDLVWAVHRGTGKLQWTWNVSKGWPKPNLKVDHILSYHDKSDLLRSLIAVDTAGNVTSFRMYGFIPTPAQEASGLTSRSLADQATARLKAGEKKADDKKDGDKPAEGEAKP